MLHRVIAVVFIGRPGSEPSSELTLHTNADGIARHADRTQPRQIAGPQDTLAAYQDHLAHDPTATGNGFIFISPKIVTINGTLWVDATLFGAELRDYFTRYLATTRDGLAVLARQAHAAGDRAALRSALGAVKYWRDKARAWPRGMRSEPRK